MITSADISSGRVKEIIRHLPCTQEVLGALREKVARKAEVSSQLVTERGETTVRVRVKLHGEHARFMIGDVENPRWLLNSMFYLQSYSWKYEWDPSVSHDNRSRAAEEAIADLVFEDEPAKAALEAIAAKVTKLIRLRSKTMPEKSKRAREAYVEDVLRDIREKLSRIKNDVDEETIILLWREILVSDAHES